MPKEEPPFTERERILSARVLSTALGALAITTLVTTILLIRQAATTETTPWILAIGSTLTFLASVVAIPLEWQRSRGAELVALAAVLSSLVVAVIVLTVGLWPLSILQGVLANATAIIVARRFVMRDERRNAIAAH